MRTILVICVILIAQGLYVIGTGSPNFGEATQDVMKYVVIVSFILDIVNPVIKN